MIELSSFAALGERFAAISEMQPAFDTLMLAEVAHKLKDHAKEKIGEYQPEAGPFAAWSGLAQSTKSDRVRSGYPEDEPLLRSGELRDSIESDSNALEAVVGSNDEIAVYQEMGTATIPPRSFLGSSLFEMAPKIVEAIGIGCHLHVAGMKLEDVVVVASAQVKVR